MKYEQNHVENHITAQGKRIMFVLCSEFENVRWNCLIFNWHSCETALGFSFFRVSAKDDGCSINWRNNTATVITRDTVINGI